MFSRKTKVLISLVFVALLLVGGGWVALRDEPPLADAHLRSFRRSVKEEENGFRLVDFTAEEVWPREEEEEETILEWHSPALDRGRAARLVEKNGAFLEKLDRCLALPEFQVDVAGFNDYHHYLKPWRSLGEVLATRARLHLESGRPLDAIEDGWRIVRFGRRIRGSQGHLIVHVIGTAIEYTGLTSLVYTAVHGKVPPEGLRRALEVLKEAPPEARWLQDCLKAEYVAMYEAIDVWAQRGELGPFLQAGRWQFRTPFFNKPNQTKRYLCEQIEHLVSAAGSPRRYEHNPADEDDEGWPGGLNRGKVLARELAMAHDSTLTRADEIRFQTAAVRALNALLLARAETGSLPLSLDELVPRYLASVPLDPFDGKPLRYSASKQVIHSVGADGKDAGGSERENPREAFGDEAEPTLRFSVEAWSPEALESKRSNAKRAKKPMKRKTP